MVNVKSYTKKVNGKRVRVSSYSRLGTPKSKMTYNPKSKPLRKDAPQTGKRKSIKADNKIKAKHPGWRKSASGKIYYETRRNRSDRTGSKL